MAEDPQYGGLSEANRSRGGAWSKDPETSSNAWWRVDALIETLWISLEFSAADLHSGTATGMIGGLKRQKVAWQNWLRVEL
jgi:hypothetical protein